MKKSVVLLVLALALLTGCEKSSTEDSRDGITRFVVLSDIHLMHPDLLVNEGKAFDEYNMEECKLLRESPEIFEATLEKAAEYKPEFLVVCGDMTKDGEVISHQYVADRFREFSEKTGAKILVVPGNHDLNNPHSKRYDGDVASDEPSATEEQFETIYKDCGYGDAVARGPRRLDYMSYPADSIAFIGVDSNEENTQDTVKIKGGLTKEQAAWIADMVKKARSEGRYVIMGMHHNLLEYYNLAALIRGENIANAKSDDYTNDELVTDLCNAGIQVVLSGHSHMHSVTSKHLESGEICSIVTSSLVNLPYAFRLCEVTEGGCLNIRSTDVQEFQPSNGVDIIEQGKSYWQSQTSFYINYAAKKCWENPFASVILEGIGFADQTDVEAFLTEKIHEPFYKFLYYTSNGNEHFYSPSENVEEAMSALDDVIEIVTQKLYDVYIEQGATEEEAHEDVLGFISLVEELLGMSMDELRAKALDFFSSAYNNYYGTDLTPVPDDAVTIHLTR